MGTLLSKDTFCCAPMRQSIEDGAVYYDPTKRDYYIRYHIKASTKIGHARDIQYCPWCSKKLPKKLTLEWFNILEREYNIETPDSTTFTNVPEEFKSDAWWIKRNL